MGQLIVKVASDNDNGYWAGSWLYGGSLGGSWGFGKNFLGGENYGSARFNNITIAQGTTITSAYLRLTDSQNQGSRTVNIKIKGVDEDDTADLTSDPDGRAKTTAGVDWDFNGVSQTTDTQRTSPDIKTVIQEIIDRAGWVSGNDLALISDDDGTGNDNIMRWYSFGGSSTKCAELEINYSGSSPSASQSPSSSVSPSPSRSPSRSPSLSVSPSPSPIDRFFGLRIIKPEAVLLGKNVFNTQEPFHYIFDSDYGTLKYFDKQTAQVTFDANAGATAGSATITHNLDYYPFVEVFVDVYIGTPSGTYEYCPFAGSGAVVAYDATYKITTTGITLYGQINGVSSSVWVFDFIVFIYKNNLNL